MSRIFLAVAFFILALVFLFLVGTGKLFCREKKFKKYYIAMTMVYMPSTLVILLVSIFVDDMPDVALVIANVMIVVIYLFTVVIAGRLIDNIKKIKTEIDAKSNKENSDN